MTKLVNRAKMTTATTGTGTITLGSAVDGYQTFAAAGVANGDVVRYVIEDGDAWEIGTGTYTATGTTLSRTVVESSNADAALNLTGNATVFVTAAAADILQPGDNISSLTNDAGYTTNIGDITGVTAGAGLTGGGASGSVTLSHADTSSQASVNNSGRTFIQDITLDTYGHVTGIVSATDADTFTGTVTSISTGGGLSGGPITTSGTISHADTSSQASVNNSGRTYIQDITLDTYGHVTGITSATETVVNTTSLPIENSAGTVQFTATDATGLQFAASGASSVAFDAVNQRVTISSTDTNTTYSAGNGIGLSGTTFSVAAGGGLTQNSTGLSHADTSSQGSVNNSGATVIQDVTLDTYGHVTALSSATLTAATLGAVPTSRTISTGSGLTGGGDLSANRTLSVSFAANQSQVKTAINAGGSAPIYACRAWVNFSNTGFVRASANVSSVTRNGTGDYTINFSTSMPDQDYSVSATSNGFQLGDVGSAQLLIAGGTTNYSSPPTLMSASAIRMNFGTDSGGMGDPNVNTVAIFR